MPETKIEWTDRTWNPVRGCTRVSEGCRHCYAERQSARGLPGHASPTTGEPFARMTKAGPRWTGAVEFLPHKLAEPLGWRKPQRVFVNSMSDLFHEALAFEEIAAVFGVMASAPQHTFQVLTKRPERAAEWFRWLETDKRNEGVPPQLVCRIGAVYASDAVMEHNRRTVERMSLEQRRSGPGTWPLPNVWLGVSVEDQATADERIPPLLRCPAAVRFVSYEPALGPVDFTRIEARMPGCRRASLNALDSRMVCLSCLALFDGEVGVCPSCSDGDLKPMGRLDWIIVGGESGPGARPFDITWARETVRQCRLLAGVPVFVKQLGSFPVVSHEAGTAKGGCHRPLKLRDRKGGDPSEWPADLRVREFPRSPEAPSL